MEIPSIGRLSAGLMSSISQTVGNRSLETTGNEDTLLLVMTSGHSIMPGTRIPPSYSKCLCPCKPFVTPQWSIALWSIIIGKPQQGIILNT